MWTNTAQHDGVLTATNSFHKSFFLSPRHIDGSIIAHDDISAFAAYIVFDAIEIDEVGMMNAEEVACV